MKTKEYYHGKEIWGELVRRYEERPLSEFLEAWYKAKNKK